MAAPARLRGGLFHARDRIAGGRPVRIEGTSDGIQQRQNSDCSLSAEDDTQFATYVAIPEPSTLVLLGIGAISLLGYRRRNANATKH